MARRWIKQGLTGLLWPFLGVRRLERQLDLLRTRAEWRATLATAEAKAIMADRLAEERATTDRQVHDAVAGAVMRLEAQLSTLRAQLDEMAADPMRREPVLADAAIPRHEAEVLQHLQAVPSALAAPPRIVETPRQLVPDLLRALQWSKPMLWRLPQPAGSPLVKELAGALHGLRHRVEHVAALGADVPALLRALPCILAEAETGPGRILVGLDWVDSGFPLDVVEWLNDHVAAIGCVSRHAARALIDQGCSVPIAVIGQGIDHWERQEAAPDYHAPGRRFRFLHVSDCGPAQALDVLLDAYGRLFDADDEVSLLVHAPDGIPAALRADLARRRAANAAFPEVLLLDDRLSHGALKALYGQCDVFVAPIRAGGFGDPIAQAFLAGVPVIATGWGGHLDYCTEETAWLVDFDFARAQSPAGVLAAAWAQPRGAALEQALWEAFRAEPAERFARARAGRKDLLSRFTWQDVALRLAQLAQRAAAPVHDGWRAPTVGFVTSWNAKCGIANYVGHMLEAVDPDEYVIFADKAQVTVRPDARNCARLWSQRPAPTDLAAIIPHLAPAAVEALVLQFNFGFFHPQEFLALVEAAVARDIAVLVEPHSTMDPPPAAGLKLADYAPGLRLCQRVLAHSPDDMNRLKAVGVVGNVTLFPLGIVVPPAPATSRPATRTAPLIASFGFALPDKGLVELVEAVGLLKAGGHRLRLRMLNAEFPNPLSPELIARIRQTIARLGLQEEVELRTEYLADEECFSLLRETDLIVNSYQNTAESSSSAVRFALASGVPVLVTPLPIFEELGDAVFRAEGISPEEMARAIAAALADLAGATPDAAKVLSASRQWIEQHDVHRQGRRLMRLARSLAATQRGA